MATRKPSKLAPIHPGEVLLADFLEPLETHGLDERDCISRHLFDRCGGRGEALDNSRGPLVQHSGQMNAEHYRDAKILLAQLAIGEVHSVCGDRPRLHVRPVEF